MFKPLLFIKPALAYKVFKSTQADYAPEDVSIEVTNVCNFKCSFCPQSNPNHHDNLPKTFLSPEKAEVLLQKLRAGGVKTNVMHWTLDGEPFLNRNFYKICNAGINFGFSNQIFSTNGSVTNLERALELPANENTKYTLCIDFCSDPLIFEKCRGTPGSWEKVKNNISSILNSDKVPHVHLSLMDISGFEIRDEGQCEIRFQQMKSLFPQSNRITFGRRIFHNATGFVKGISKEKSTKFNVCPHPWFSFVVSANGDVVSCSRDLEHKTVLGNLFKQDLMEIWNGDSYKEFRSHHKSKNISSVKACSGCDLPYDAHKSSFPHLVKTAIGRLQLFSR